MTNGAGLARLDFGISFGCDFDAFRVDARIACRVGICNETLPCNSSEPLPLSSGERENFLFEFADLTHGRNYSSDPAVGATNIAFVTCDCPQGLATPSFGTLPSVRSKFLPKRICREFYADPNWSWLAWGRQASEEEEKLLGPDPWPYGLEKNRANLERFVGY